MIEKVSGLSFEAFLKKRVFPTAGIRDAVAEAITAILNGKPYLPLSEATVRRH
jgi:CubicO group peptidase (beta-lactamase class C family)